MNSTPVSIRAASQYQAIDATPMSAWIGVGQAAQIGSTNAQIVDRLAPLREAQTLLDFGCGLGRTAVGVLDLMPASSRFVGIDIVPDMVDFCQQQIAAVDPRASFFCTNTPHEVYDNVKRDRSEGLEEDALLARLQGSVDTAFAFSVFTHLRQDAVASYFRKLAVVLRPAGRLVFTAFILDEESRQALAEGRAFGHSDHPPAPGDEVYMPDHNLDFVAFDGALLRRMLDAAGLVVESLAYGAWRGRPSALGLSFMQDSLCVRKRPVLPPGFDAAAYVALNPDVAAHATGPIRHYLDFGYDEERRWR